MVQTLASTLTQVYGRHARSPAPGSHLRPVLALWPRPAPPRTPLAPPPPRLPLLLHHFLQLHALELHAPLAFVVQDLAVRALHQSRLGGAQLLLGPRPVA